MGITSLGLLKFSLSCIYLLAWPVIALGYPLFASIRAVENNSKYQMRKLVIYWTLFSLFSLFEFAFVKIIEWIPFWSSVRLVVIFWLVMPRFEGSYLAYQGLVRPALLVKLQAVIYSFYNLKEERLCKRQTCVDVVENYIKEYGSEALEELIASENESQKRIDFQRGTKIIEQEEENSAATSKEICYEQSNSSARVRNGTYAITNVKEMTPPEASAENRRCETAPLKKSQQEWTCDLCKVTSASRSMLNAHLQGSKHKSKLESLKASLLDAIKTGPSPLVQYAQSVSAAWDLKGTYAAADVKEIMPPKEMAEKRRPEAPLLERAQQEWTCDICKVTTTNEITFNGHLQGSKHKSKLETTLKASNLGAKDEGPSPSASSKLKDGNVAEKLIKESGSELENLIANKTGRGNSHKDVQAVESEDKNGPEASQQVQYANFEVEEITPPKASGIETPTLKEAQQEWTCDLCKVTTKSEITFNGHLQGRKHKSKLETTLKASNLGAKDEGPSHSATSKLKDGNVAEKLIKESGSEPENLIASKTWCGECIISHRDVQVVESEDKNGPAASQQVQFAYVEVEEITPPKASGTENPTLKEAQQEWTCDLCKVTTKCEITFNGHLQGRKHKSKLETTLKASNLGAKDEGPSHSATSKLKDGNVAEKLIKESGSELEKLIANKTGRGECSNSHRYVQVVESKDKNGPAASQQVQYANVEVEEITPPKAIGAETPTLKEAMQEWTCDLCNVTTTSEITFIGHLQGCKHNSKLVTTLKASNFGAKDEGPSHLATSKLKDGNVAEKLIKESGSELENLIAIKTWHGECINSHRDVQVVESEDSTAASQQVQYANVEVEEIMPPKASGTETPTLKEAQQEWTCDLCKLTTKSEITFNGHLQGRKHKSKLETTLKASNLGAKDEGPSHLATSKLKDGNVAEKLIKESGSELENLIANKTGCGECSNSHRDVQVVESMDKNGPAASQQVPYANAEVKEITLPKASCAETPTLKEAQQEWTCDLCRVTTTSEITLNGHLHWCKHKSKLETTLKASTLGAKDKGRSPSATSKLNDDNVAEKLIKESSELEKLIASKTRHAESSSSPGDVQVVKSEENNGPAASQQVQYANAEVEEIAPPKATSCAETPPLKKTQQEWRCDLCNVKATSEKNLNAHLWGSKHTFVFESLKTSKLPAKDTGLSRSQRYKVNQSNLVVTKIKDGAFKYWCNVCGVKLLTYVDVASHLKGKQHSSNMNL